MAKPSITERYLRTLEENQINQVEVPKSVKPGQLAQSPNKVSKQADFGSKEGREGPKPSSAFAERVNNTSGQTSPLKPASKLSSARSVYEKTISSEYSPKASNLSTNSPTKQTVSFTDKVPNRSTPVFPTEIGSSRTSLRNPPNSTKWASNSTQTGSTSLFPSSKAVSSASNASKPTQNGLKTATSAPPQQPKYSMPKSVSTPAFSKTIKSEPQNSSLVGAKPDRKPLMHNEDLSPSEISWDNERRNWQAYEYLCHVVEAKNWMEKILNEELPSPEEFPASLQNGVALAKITQVLRPQLMKWPIFEHKRLQYRHTENITQFFSLLADLQIPQLFLFDMTDLYEKRNIPKVIYCIHAVSHYIAEEQKKYSAVENLVGKLEFSSEELKNTEKTIEGHNLPNFKAMNRKLSTTLEREETREEEREASGSSNSQSPSLDDTTTKRAKFNVEKRPRDIVYNDKTMSDEESDEELITAPRMRRTRQKPPVEELDSLDIKPLRRSRRSEPSLSDRTFSPLNDKLGHNGRVFSPTFYNNRYSRHDSRSYGYRNVSSMTMLRKEAFTTAERILQTLETLEPEIVQLQAVCRSQLVRRNLPSFHQKRAVKSNPELDVARITELQSIFRGIKARKAFNSIKSDLSKASPHISQVQAIVRSQHVRTEFKSFSEGLQFVCRFQAFVRGRKTRSSLHQLKQELSTDKTVASVTRVQATVKSHLFRRAYKAMAENVNDVVHFQGLARGVLARRQILVLNRELKAKLSQRAVVNVQSAFRGTLLRSYVEYLYTCMHKDVASIVKTQSLGRRKLEKAKFQRITTSWRRNVELITAIQSIYRSQKQGFHYRNLINSNPSFSSIKQFVFLIEDNSEDYELEKQLETLSKLNNLKIQANEKLETEIHQLDMKVSMLGKNGVNLDEIGLKNQRQNKDLLSSTMPEEPESSSEGQVDLSMVRKTTRDRIELYECLMYILQTKPEYTKQLMRLKPVKPFRIGELVFSIFGMAKSRREKYFLLNALEACITQSKVGDEENTVSWELVSFLNTDKESTEIRKKVLLRACSKLKLITDQLLEYDPHLIYENLTGGGDLSPEEAIRDPTVRSVFVLNLQNLREVTATIIQDLIAYLDKLPFHILYLAKQAFATTLQLTGNHSDGLSSAAQVVISQFVHPALLSADSLELVDTAVGNTTKNLLFVSRIVHQIGVMIPFASNGTSDIFLQPLNEFVKQTSKQLSSRLETVLQTVPTLSEKYKMNEGADYTSHERPNLRISVPMMLALHSTCYAHLNTLTNPEDTCLRTVIELLGPVPRDAREMVDLGQFKQLKLQLNPKYCTSTLSSQTDGAKTLLEAAQRCLGYVLQVHTSSNDVLSVLLEKVTVEDEHKYNLFLDQGTNREKAGELGTLSFRELKYLTLEKFLELESIGVISRKDGYQALINKIASDIRNKGSARSKREHALATKDKMRQELDKKNEYLRQRLAAYDQDIHKALKSLQLNAMQLSAGKNKRFQRFGLSKDELVVASGPQYGKYKASAEKLFERGILMRLLGYSDRQRKDVIIAFSSFEVAEFVLEITYKSILLPNGSFKLRVDDLLLNQYHGHQYMEFLDGSVQFSTNRLLKLVFRKFFAA